MVLPSALLVILLALAVPAWAQVTLDAVGSGNCGDNVGETACGGGGLTLTYAVTVGTGANRALAVFTELGCNSTSATTSISGITYAGVALVQNFGTAVTPASCSATCLRVDLWNLPPGTQPTSGTNNVVVTKAASQCSGATPQSLQSGAFAVAGVDQTTVYTATKDAFGNSTSASVTLSASGANDLVVFSACNGTSVALNGNNVGTQRYRNNTSTHTTCDSAAGASAPGGNLTLSWTTSSDKWGIGAASFKVSTASDTSYLLSIFRARMREWMWLAVVLPATMVTVVIVACLPSGVMRLHDAGQIAWLLRRTPPAPRRARPERRSLTRRW
jgi:hypothetical protein